MDTDARKQSRKKWDEQNMAYQTVKVNKKLLEDFRQAVADRGDRVNTVILRRSLRSTGLMFRDGET